MASKFKINDEIMNCSMKRPDIAKIISYAKGEYKLIWDDNSTGWHSSYYIDLNYQLATMAAKVLYGP